jgi:hypothetical protein
MGTNNTPILIWWVGDIQPPQVSSLFSLSYSPLEGEKRSLPTGERSLGNSRATSLEFSFRQLWRATSLEFSPALASSLSPLPQELFFLPFGDPPWEVRKAISSKKRFHKRSTEEKALRRRGVFSTKFSSDFVIRKRGSSFSPYGKTT